MFELSEELVIQDVMLCVTYKKSFTQEDNVDLTPEEMEKSKAILLNHVPKDGAAIGNKSARLQLMELIKEEFGKTISEDDYWTIRNSLMNDGKIIAGRGNGGSIVLVNASIPHPTESASYNKYTREADLYPPVRNTIIDAWVKNYGIDVFISEVTAMQGKRDTGGPWTRPDITLFAVRAYPYIPGKSIELITFEIKPLNSYYIGGVFETASHSAIAHRSYLMVHVSIPLDKATEPLLDRLESEAGRMKVGFVTFGDPKDYETYNVRVEAVLKKPDPANLCKFINAQFSQLNKDKIQAMIK